LLQLIGEVKLMAIQAFGIALDPDMCRLHIDDDPDAAHIPRKKENSSIRKKKFGFFII
jgi:hypothetical protein